jgi:hypothetical protein
MSKNEKKNRYYYADLLAKIFIKQPSLSTIGTALTLAVKLSITFEGFLKKR